MSGRDQGWDEGSPERLYVITKGRSSSPEAALDLVTLIVARSEPRPEMQPEHTAILRMCRFPLSVAELTAYLDLPFSVVTVLLADLLTDDLVQAQAPVQLAQLPDIALIEAVIHGLQKL
jgi:hypothetical protein